MDDKVVERRFLKLAAPAAGRTAVWRLFDREFAVAPLVVLLLVDSTFILMHALHNLKVQPFTGVGFNLGLEVAHAEAFQNFKELGITVMLALLAWRHRSATFTVWALVFAYLTLDDTFQFHERGGAMLAHRWQLLPRFGLRAQDFGELLVTAAVGGALILAVAAVAMRGRASLRAVSRDLLALLVLLVVFGVGVDMLHIVGPAYGLRGMGLLEDGGEMLVMSLIAAYALALWRAPARPGAPWG